MKRLVIALVRFYQRYISPRFAPKCKYVPSCSAYFIDAVEKKGLVLGMLSGAWRILRCNPFSKGGFDPVK